MWIMGIIIFMFSLVVAHLREIRFDLRKIIEILEKEVKSNTHDDDNIKDILSKLKNEINSIKYNTEKN